MHYLDHAATTPVPVPVAEALCQTLTRGYGNPSSQYALGRAARDQLSAHRETLSKALGCAPAELCFTSCGTEGDNWAIQAALWQNRHLGKHIVTSVLEHSAVTECCRMLEQQGYSVTWLRPKDSSGLLTAAQVLDAVREDTALVSLMLVNNEIGTVNPIAEIAAGLPAKNPKTLLHTDAVQGFMKLPFTTGELGADFVVLSAHKIGGPKGVGALYLGPRVKNPLPLLPGGGQEGGRRSGTEATGQIAAFAKAVELRFSTLEQDIAHMAELKDYVRQRLSTVPGLKEIGGGTAPHILALSLEGYPSQNVVADLDEKEIYISAGSACHQGKPSHVVAALNLPKRLAAGVLRISFGPESGREDVDALLDALLAHSQSRFPML